LPHSQLTFQFCCWSFIHAYEKKQAAGKSIEFSFGYVTNKRGYWRPAAGLESNQKQQKYGPRTLNWNLQISMQKG